MFAKKIWIPVVCVLIGVAIGATFWGQHIASQEPVKVINPATAEEVDASKPTTPKPPPPGETAESGHWHGDVWHAEVHETVVAESFAPVEMLKPLNPPPQADDVAAEFLKKVDAIYPDFHTHEEVQEFLTSSSADQIYARVRDMYIARHYEKHPYCTEHEAILADAEHHAVWYQADREHREKHKQLSDEWEAIESETDEISDRIANMTEGQLNQFFDTMSDSEREAFVSKIMDSEKRAAVAYERLKASRSQRPVSPEPMHTH